jgi:acyl carrier protein
MSADAFAIDRVRDLIREVVSVEVPSDETDLIEDGLIDSLALVTIVAELEEQFGVEFALDDFNVDQFRSVDRIVETLLRMATLSI